MTQLQKEVKIYELQRIIKNAIHHSRVSIVFSGTPLESLNAIDRKFRSKEVVYMQRVYDCLKELEDSISVLLSDLE